jgi:hypothetical protein
VIAVSRSRAAFPDPAIDASAIRTELADAGDATVVGSAYASDAGQSVKDYLGQLDYAPLTPRAAGAALVKLTQGDAADVAPAYTQTGAGLQKRPSPRGP